MSNIKDHVTGTGAHRPGVASELRQARLNGSASAAELREFAGTLRGRSPQEVLGAVAQSGLTRGIVIATIGTVVLLVVGSVIPYGLNKMWPETATAAAEPAEDSQATGDDAQQPAESGAAADRSTTAGTGTPAKADGEELSDALGIGETETSDPKTNPLEASPKLDNLLDGLE